MTQCLLGNPHPTTANALVSSVKLQNRLLIPSLSMSFAHSRIFTATRQLFRFVSFLECSILVTVLVPCVSSPKEFIYRVQKRERFPECRSRGETKLRDSISEHSVSTFSHQPSNQPNRDHFSRIHRLCGDDTSPCGLRSRPLHCPPTLSVPCFNKDIII